jgi:hypothetical protein
MNQHLTVDLDTDLAHEIVIALTERIVCLRRELRTAPDDAFEGIIRRQISRTYGARAGVVDALEGIARKAA